VTLSGTVSWLKLKYGSAGKLQLYFSMQQPYVHAEDGTVVSTGHVNFFCACFKNAERYQDLKEGCAVAIQGKLSSVPSETGGNVISIVVEKIDILHGHTED